MSQRVKQFILIFGDIVVLYFSLWLTLIVRYIVLPDAERWSQHTGPFTLVYLIWIIVFFIIGLYSIGGMRSGFRFATQLIRAMAVNGALGALFFYLTPFVGISPKTNFLINLFLSTLLILLWREGANRMISSSQFKHNILLIGEDEQLKDITLELERQPQLGYTVAKTINPLSVHATNINLAKMVKDNAITIIAAESRVLRDPQLTQQLFNMLSLHISVVDLARFMEEVTGKIPLNVIEQSWFLENLNLGKQRGLAIAKRTMDIILASFGLIVISWLFVCVALAVYITMGRPVFYTQRRSGQHGTLLTLIKFRSMVNNAEKNGPQWAQKNDPRITPFGRFLRKTRLDELPQFVNILKGDLSFVGPRPERPEFIKQLQQKIPFYNERLLVKPGATGWAQISFPYGASEEDALEKLQYDLYYIKNRSVIFDLAILLRTLKTIFTAGGQ